MVCKVRLLTTSAVEQIVAVAARCASGCVPNCIDEQGDVINLFVVPDRGVDWLKALEAWTTCTGGDECR
jgi:hypothetical protein